MGVLPEKWSQWREQVRVDQYDERWQRMQAQGRNPHGEADFVCSYAPHSVLDAGCGTGRVAVELARRGIDVVGTDLEPDMIAAARAKAPELTWVIADLSELELAQKFDVVVLAGNVIPYVAPERREAAVAACARHLSDRGRLIVGFQLQPGWPTMADYDGWCARAGLELQSRFATWHEDPYVEGTSSFAVSVHVRRG